MQLHRSCMISHQATPCQQRYSVAGRPPLRRTRGVLLVALQLLLCGCACWCPLTGASAGRAAAAAAAAGAEEPGRLHYRVKQRHKADIQAVNPALQFLMSNLLASPASDGGSISTAVSSNSGNSSSSSSNSSSTSLPDSSSNSSSYKYFLTHHQLEKGLARLGTVERLRRVLAKAMAGGELVVSVVGASISAGHGADDAPSWVARVETYLNQTFGAASPVGGRVRLHNGAVPGTTSSYMAACMRLHVPEDADIVLVEYAVNDLKALDLTPPFDNPDRRAFERLLRKLLQLPNHPAVILVNAYTYLVPYPHLGSYWSNTEEEFNAFASYYNMPSLSIKGCCYGAMLANATGFQVHTWRQADKAGTKGQVFYWDDVHPDGHTGHRAMADLVIHLLQRTALGLTHRPLNLLDHAAAAARLPIPMIPNNYASPVNQCFMGPKFKAKSVIGADGWEWINESKKQRPKWGYISTTPGSTLVLQVNATASSGDTNAPVLVQIGYLSSYEHMGKAVVRCATGCACNPTTINGHWNKTVSLTSLHPVRVTPSPDCRITIAVLPDTDSGEHKVKIMAVMVSEEGGDARGIDNPGAVEHVHDISFRHKANSTLFDIRDHV